jgi:hypothetical protein
LFINYTSLIVGLSSSIHFLKSGLFWASTFCFLFVVEHLERAAKEYAYEEKIAELKANLETMKV